MCISARAMDFFHVLPLPIISHTEFFSLGLTVWATNSVSSSTLSKFSGPDHSVEALFALVLDREPWVLLEASDPLQEAGM